jgi:hypothetical protein
MHDVSTTAIQVCVLLGSYAAGNGEIEAENLYYALAGRMALALDLPNRPTSGPLEREVHTRSQSSPIYPSYPGVRHELYC